MGFSCGSVDTRLAKDAQNPGFNIKHPRNKDVWVGLSPNPSISWARTRR